jgi:hypothetical protein
VRDDIAPLLEIQLLRSKVGGVHNASDAQKILARLNPSGLPWNDWFTDIVERAIQVLGFIEQAFTAPCLGSCPEVQSR